MRGKLTCLACAALIVAAMAYQGREATPRLMEPAGAHLTAISGFSSETETASKAELHTLPKDTVIEKCRYRDDFGNWFLVSLVTGGANKSSIHRPELCLPTQGFQMKDPQTVTVAGRNWRLIRLVSGGSTQLGFAYSFFNQDGYRTQSHVKRIFRDVCDRSFLNRIDRWTMVTVNTSAGDERTMTDFLAKLEVMLR